MACRSSVAEITGNRRMNAQPRAQTKTSGRAAGLFAGLPEATEAVRRRHSSQAGSNRESQQRLRKSSIQNAPVRGGNTTTWKDSKDNQNNQDSTTTASDLRNWRPCDELYGGGTGVSPVQQSGGR